MPYEGGVREMFIGIREGKSEGGERSLVTW